MSAQLLGNVHGVVVQARMNTSPNASLKSHFAMRFALHLNCATTLVSFTGL